jgi:integrase
VWRPALRRAQLRVRTLYQTRHTFATLMLELGESPGWVPSNSVTRTLRWSIGDTTGSFRIYAVATEKCGKGAGARGALRTAMVTRWSLDMAKGLRVSP